MTIDAATRLIAIIGHPVEHSMTPVLQNAALWELQANVRNVAFDVAPERLGEAVAGARALGLLGLMVTIPHKVAVIEHLDQLDDFAARVQSVNLVHYDGQRTIGYNTDGYAAVRSLEEEGVVIRGARITVLGAGGAGKCLAQMMAYEGAAHVAIANRTEPKAAKLAATVREKFQTPASSLPLTRASLQTCLSETDILINTTSVGMHPHELTSPVPASLLHPGLAVFDIVYNPLETRLLADARAAGCRCIDGVGMLVYTNVRAVQICAGLEPSVRTMRRACVEALKARQSPST